MAHLLKLMPMLDSCRVVESLKRLATSLTLSRQYVLSFVLNGTNLKSFIVRFRFRIKYLFLYKRYIIDNFRPNNFFVQTHNVRFVLLRKH